MNTKRLLQLQGVYKKYPLLKHYHVLAIPAMLFPYNKLVFQLASIRGFGLDLNRWITPAAATLINFRKMMEDLNGLIKLIVECEVIHL